MYLIWRIIISLSTLINVWTFLNCEVFQQRSNKLYKTHEYIYRPYNLHRDIIISNNVYVYTCVGVRIVTVCHVECAGRQSANATVCARRGHPPPLPSCRAQTSKSSFSPVHRCKRLLFLIFSKVVDRFTRHYTQSHTRQYPLNHTRLTLCRAEKGKCTFIYII